MTEQLPKIGDPIDAESPPLAFELNLVDHLVSINPIDFKLSTDTASIDPARYFITSGDAVAKAKKLEKDLWALAGQLKAEQKTNTNKAFAKYCKAVWQCAGKCRTLVHKLEQARGAAVFLELEWRSDGCGTSGLSGGSTLVVIAKNPRIKNKEESNG